MILTRLLSGVETTRFTSSKIINTGSLILQGNKEIMLFRSENRDVRYDRCEADRFVIW